MTATTHSQKIRRRAKLSLLSESCPFDHGNPPTCLFYKLRKKSLKKRTAWLDELSEEAILNIYIYCRLCSEVKKR